MKIRRESFHGKTLQNYEIQDLIGIGGQGEVYTCLHIASRQIRAVKFLKATVLDEEESIERFRNREVRAQSSLTHDNIVQVLDWIEDEEEGIYGIVMEYVPGETLKQIIEREGPLSFQKSLSISIQIGTALAFAHQHGIIHRDVKSSNILVNKDRKKAKLTDFGIALIVSPQKFTRTRLVLGTLEYMSPEQIRGEKVDERSDIYSLGIVFYEILTGRLPFTGETEYEIQQKQLKSKPVPPSSLNQAIPRRLEKVLFRALEKERTRRYSAIDVFIREIATFFLPEVESTLSPVTVEVKRAEKVLKIGPGSRGESTGYIEKTRVSPAHAYTRNKRLGLITAFSLILLGMMALTNIGLKNYRINSMLSRDAAEKMETTKKEREMEYEKTIGEGKRKEMQEMAAPIPVPVPAPAAAPALPSLDIKREIAMLRQNFQEEDYQKVKADGDSLLRKYRSKMKKEQENQVRDLVSRAERIMAILPPEEE
ncbi:MAG: serine/threonine-protein kinase [Candidatus Omnitrophota bacterium]